MNKLKAFVILAVISALALCLGSFFSPIFGETEEECTVYKSPVFVKLQTVTGGGCEWLASEYIYKNFTVAQYDSVPTNGHFACGCEIIILTKNPYENK